MTRCCFQILLIAHFLLKTFQVSPLDIYTHINFIYVIHMYDTTVSWITGSNSLLSCNNIVYSHPYILGLTPCSQCVPTHPLILGMNLWPNLANGMLVDVMQEEAWVWANPLTCVSLPWEEHGSVIQQVQRERERHGTDLDSAYSLVPSPAKPILNQPSHKQENENKWWLF